MDDEKIIELYFQRSERAIEETKSKFGGLCVSVAYRILKNTQDAEECLVDALLRVWNSIPPNRPLPLSPYVAKIARNLALDRYTYNTAQKRNTGLEEAFEELDACISAPQQVEDVLDEKELAGSISRYLRGLKKDARIIFVRRYWYGDSYAEISGRLEISESKVKSSLFRSRRGLMEYLRKEGVAI